MRKVKAWGLAAILVLGSVPAAGAAADDQTDGAAAPPDRPFIRWSPYARAMMGLPPGPPPEKKPPKKPAKTQKAEAKKPAAPQKAARSAPNARAQDESVLLRRLAVCDKLKEIALRTNDETLLRQADDLEARAWATYQQRAGSAAAGAASAAVVPVLEQPAGARSAATLSGIETPARPYPVKAGGMAAAKEVDQ